MPLFSSGVGREEERELIIVRVSMRARLEEKEEEEEVVGLLEEGGKSFGSAFFEFYFVLTFDACVLFASVFRKSPLQFSHLLLLSGPKAEKFPPFPALDTVRNFIFLRERSVGYEIQ